MDVFSITLEDIYHFLLILFRTGALFMTVPIFGHMSIPRIMRIAFVLIFGFVIFPSTVLTEAPPPSTMINLMLAIASEVFIGLLIGFGVIIIFSAVQFAGHIIGLQMGLAVATIFDPMGAGQISIIGQFYYFLCLLVFLLINGHHIVIEALVKSFELVPLAGGVFSPNIAEYLITMTGMVFVVAVKIAAPVIITLFIMYSILGIIARTVPQMNVFIVGFPIAIGVGLALIGVTLPVFKIIVEKAFLGLDRYFLTIIRMLQG